MRTITADPDVFDLLIVDEPQTMLRDALQTICQASDEFRQVLVLSATPRLGDPAWREPIMRMIEPEAAALARILGRDVTKKTTHLVVGDQDLTFLAGHTKSSKHRRGEEMQSFGHPIQIIGETEFKTLVNKAEAH